MSWKMSDQGEETNLHGSIQGAIDVNLLQWTGNFKISKQLIFYDPLCVSLCPSKLSIYLKGENVH